MSLVTRYPCYVGGWRVLQCLAFGSLTACNALYGIDETRLTPPADLDTDDDTVEDLVDNCPTVGNTTQADEDEDGVGNACDDCPLFANARQTDIDADGVGDLCDPHPISPGDCLVLFDSFDDPNAFATSWEVKSMNATPTINPTGGVVDVDASMPGTVVSIRARGLDGAFDVHAVMASKLAAAAARAGVASSMVVDMPDRCYSCFVHPDPFGFAPYVDFTVVNASSSVNLSSLPIGDVIVARLERFAKDGGASPVCRLEYGVGAAVAFVNTLGPLPPPDLRDGAPGFKVSETAVQLRGIAVYDYAGDRTTCAPAVRR